ncbi:MAG: GntR family transcriptional regulator [Spirochaetota bacterium]
MPEIIKEKGSLPKYLQLSEWLKGMIEKGRYGVDERLPSETELSQMFHLNRNTVRQAILQLVNEGLVVKKNGVGTFVKSKTDNKVKYPLEHITSLTYEFSRLNIRIKTHIISKKVITADSEMAQKLMLGSDKRAIQIKRVRYGNDIPLVIERSYLSFREYRNILSMHIPDSLYKLLIENFNVTFERSVQRLRAIELPDKDAELLGVEPGFPAMFQESITYDKNNITVELLQSYYRGDKFVFSVESGRLSPTDIT